MKLEFIQQDGTPPHVTSECVLLVILYFLKEGGAAMHSLIHLYLAPCDEFLDIVKVELGRRGLHEVVNLQVVFAQVVELILQLAYPVM
jgi:hypothetical protein